MARIFGATYQPYTYEELAAPLREATAAHQQVEEDYTNSMLVVDSLRQRAASELESNPNSKWANDIINYANNLEAYATDLARNGLTRLTSSNLLQAKRGFGTTVSPILTAMLREKELLSVRDKSIGLNIVFGQMPSLDEIIANPNIGQTAYNMDDLYNKAMNMAASMSERNILVFDPLNYNYYLYKYGLKKGFSNNNIAEMLKLDPGFGKLFSSLIEQSGYMNDSGLDSDQISLLNNAITLGALTGFKYSEDWKYGNRGDAMTPLQRLQYENLKNQNNPPLFGYTGPIGKSEFNFFTGQDPFSKKQSKKGDTDATVRTYVYKKIDSENYEDVRSNFFFNKDNTIPLTKYNGVYVRDENQEHINPQKYNPVRVEVDNEIGPNGVRIVWQNKDTGEEVKTSYFDTDKAKEIQQLYLETSYRMNADYENKINHDGDFKKRNVQSIISGFDDDILNSIGYSKDEILNKSKTLSNSDFVYYIDNIGYKYYGTEYNKAKLNGEDESIQNMLLLQCQGYMDDMVGYNNYVDYINESLDDILGMSLRSTGKTTKIEAEKIE